MDAFDRAKRKRDLQIQREKAPVTVPDAVCDPCQLREHPKCERTAISVLLDDVVPCMCACRKMPRSMGAPVTRRDS
jgi:hypothetical protein